MTKQLRTSTILVVLIGGFLSFAAAVMAAHTTPATGYEVSIYRSTPTPFWVGIGIGFVCAIGSLLGSPSRRISDAAMLLASMCLLAVIAIPLLRGYAFYGSGDSLTHLGWAREMYSGAIDPDVVLYPADHLIAVALTGLTGVELTRTLTAVSVLIFPLAYLLAMPLCVASITDSRWAVPVGVLSALLLIPINKISVHVVAHPSSQAILFAPFVVFLLLGYLKDGTTGFPLATRTGGALAIALFGMLLVHPQETMTLLSMLGAMVLVQVVARRYASDHPIAGHRPLGTHTFVLGVGLIAWLFRQERAVNRFWRVIDGFMTLGLTTGTETAERGISLAALGGSFEELFVKLFAVTVVVCIPAAAVLYLNLAGKLDPAKPWRNAVFTYLTAGLVPPTALFVVIFVANQGNHYFRFLGFITAIVTVISAVALAMYLDRSGSGGSRYEGSRFGESRRGESRSEASFSRSRVLAVVGVIVLVLLAAQLLVVHQSPYIYQPNQQVTESDFSGHDVAFAYHDGETPLLGLRRGQIRHIDAYFGREHAQREMAFPGYDVGVPGEVFNTNLSTHYESDQYLVVGDRDEQRELDLYDELRYTRDGFTRLETSHRINRVQDNGDFRLYRIVAS